MLALCASHKINYAVYGSGRIQGCEFKGIPKVFIVNWKGEVCWDGRHDGLESAVESALKDAPDWLAGPREYVHVKAEADKVRKRKGMGSAVNALREKAESADGEEKEEAADLLGRLLGYADRERKKADALVEAGDPLAAVQIWKALAKDFKGDAIGDEAAALEKEKAKDPAFKRELEAAKILAGMEASADRIDPPRRGEDEEKWKKKNQGALMGILGLFKKLESRYADTKVFGRAQALLKTLRIG